MIDAFAERRELMLGWAREIPSFKVNEPKGAFYLFPDVSATFGKIYNGVQTNNADDLALDILEYAQVAVVSGSAFGSKKCIRISYAASVDSLKEAMTRIKNALIEK